MSADAIGSIALVGYGEVGTILAEDLVKQGLTVSAWDLKLRTHPGDEAAVRMHRHAEANGVRLCDGPARALAGAHLVISVVTASQTLSAASECAPLLEPGALFLDCNSASPGAKQSCARTVEDSGGRYVEAAVMTSVPPFRIQVPMLLGGAWADHALPALTALGFKADVASDKVGVASATKMCRSIMIKGLEAMVIESFTTARAYGVEDAVIQSLVRTFPGLDWEKEGSYFFHRVLLHGRRRAEEMREVVATVREAGLDGWIAGAAADRDDWMADLADAHDLRQTHPGIEDWRGLSDHLLALLKAKEN
ncbi:MAG: hypothetical protein FD176_3482 [Rhodospirillaceae bacterium]|nr:MAG: hypothetical protein FD176_3482 [Rhodospirillaceae bacterium]TNC95348.1 MAG: dehydrogenase [Stygiobacter sp.]